MYQTDIEAHRYEKYLDLTGAKKGKKKGKAGAKGAAKKKKK